MGCSTSRLDDEEAVQLCKDRKNFIKQAVEQRSQFSSSHVAYIHSLKCVSSSLRAFVDAYEPSEQFLNSFITPPFTPIKKTNPGFLSNSPKSNLKLNFLRSEAPMAVSMEERLPSPEMARVEAFSPVHQYGIDGFFAMQSSPMNSSSFYSFSPNNLPNFPPPSPQTSQWDFFWNPFSSLDYYGYPTSSSLDQTAMEDEIRGLRKVREEEGIPELEEEEEEEEEETEQDKKQFPIVNNAEGVTKINPNFKREEVIIEDVDEEDDETESEEEVKDLQCHKAQNGGKVDTNSPKKALRRKESKEESPGFTVYVNRKPTSMGEVMKELETQFTMICNSVSEVSTLLEASRATCSSTSNELTAMKMLNPVALFRSASSRSTSSRFLGNSSASRDEGYESSSDFSEESCMFSGSHQSTLDRLYAWEKKLYNEVKAGEKIRIAYEKKWNHLKEQDVKGDDPSSVEKTRVAIRDLYTQIKVSIHSVEAISKRIETLRDQELQPQLIELIHGLTRMWRVKAKSHQSQKRTLDEAKLLLAGLPSKPSGKKHFSTMSSSEPHKLPSLAANLETELRNWRACFDAWITSQRSYVHAISGWLLRCVRCDSDTSKLPFSPRRSCGTLPVFGLCIQWSRFLDAMRDTPVLDGLDFFAAGMGSLYTQRREDYRRGSAGSKRVGMAEENGRNMEIVEISRAEEAEEEEMSEEKRAEVAIRVLCAGMSVAMTSLSEFSLASAEGYDELVKAVGNQEAE